MSDPEPQDYAIPMKRNSSATGFTVVATAGKTFTA
jgi:hypothetical protein